MGNFTLSQSGFLKVGVVVSVPVLQDIDQKLLGE
jgi:hypothetical protein